MWPFSFFQGAKESNNSFSLDRVIAIIEKAERPYKWAELIATAKRNLTQANNPTTFEQTFSEIISFLAEYSFESCGLSAYQIEKDLWSLLQAYGRDTPDYITQKITGELVTFDLHIREDRDVLRKSAIADLKHVVNAYLNDVNNPHARVEYERCEAFYRQHLSVQAFAPLNKALQELAVICWEENPPKGQRLRRKKQALQKKFNDLEWQPPIENEEEPVQDNEKEKISLIEKLARGMVHSVASLPQAVSKGLRYSARHPAQSFTTILAATNIISSAAATEVPVIVRTGTDASPAIATAADGRFAVAYHSADKGVGSGLDPWVQMFDANQTRGNSFIVGDAPYTGTQQYPGGVYFDNDTKLRVFYEDAALQTLLYQDFDSITGNPLGSPQDATNGTIPALSTRPQQIIQWPEGYFLHVFPADDGDQHGIFALPYAPDGTQLAGFWVHQNMQSEQTEPVAVIVPNGVPLAALFAWITNHPGTNDFDIAARLMTYSGGAISDETAVMSDVGRQDKLTLVVDPDNSSHLGYRDGNTIKQLGLNMALQPQGAATTVPTNSTGIYDDPHVVGLGNDEYIVFFRHDEFNNGTSTVEAQRFAGNGNRINSQFTASETSDNYVQITAAALVNGAPIIGMTRVGSNSDPDVYYKILDLKASLVNNELGIEESGYVILSESNIGIIKPGGGEGGVPIVFSDLQHVDILRTADNSTILSVNYDDIRQGRVAARHDGSEVAPSLSVSADGEPAQATQVTFTPVDDAPEFSSLPHFSVVEGGSVTLTTQNFPVIDPDNTASEVSIIVTQSDGGEFRKSGILTTQFTVQDLLDRKIEWAHSGEEIYPVVEVYLDDGEKQSPAQPVNVNFAWVNDPPEVLHKRIKVGENEEVILSAEDLGATDPDTSPESLIWSVDVEGGEFLDAEGEVVTEFSQAQINNGDIKFKATNTDVTCSFTLTDGENETDKQDIEVDVVPARESDVTGVVIGIITAVLASLGIGFCLYKDSKYKKAYMAYGEKGQIAYAVKSKLGVWKYWNPNRNGAGVAFRAVIEDILDAELGLESGKLNSVTDALVEVLQPYVQYTACSIKAWKLNLDEVESNKGQLIADIKGKLQSLEIDDSSPGEESPLSPSSPS